MAPDPKGPVSIDTSNTAVVELMSHPLERKTWRSW